MLFPIIFFRFLLIYNLQEGILDEWGHRNVPTELDVHYELRQQIGEGTSKFPFAPVIVLACASDLRS
jgi:hypothetical protein